MRMPYVAQADCHYSSLHCTVCTACAFESKKHNLEKTHHLFNVRSKQKKGTGVASSLLLAHVLDHPLIPSFMYVRFRCVRYSCCGLSVGLFFLVFV